MTNEFAVGTPVNETCCDNIAVCPQQCIMRYYIWEHYDALCYSSFYDYVFHVFRHFIFLLLIEMLFMYNLFTVSLIAFE